MVEKTLNLILKEIKEMKNGLQDVKHEQQEMKMELQDVKHEQQSMKQIQESILSRLDSLEVKQDMMAEKQSTMEKKQDAIAEKQDTMMEKLVQNSEDITAIKLDFHDIKTIQQNQEKTITLLARRSIDQEAALKKA